MNSTKILVFSLSVFILICGCTKSIRDLSSCSTAAKITTPVDELHSVFGVALGQPLSLPECPKRYSYDSSLSYDDSKMTCWKRWDYMTGVVCNSNPIIDDWVYVDYPLATLPYWAEPGGAVTARLIGSRVEGVRILTTGINGQDAALQALVEKYGNPSSSLKTEQQNLMGAKYISLNSSWDIGNINILMLGVTGRFDRGIIEITTKIGSEAFKAEDAKLKKKFKPL